MRLGTDSLKIILLRVNDLAAQFDCNVIICQQDSRKFPRVFVHESTNDGYSYYRSIQKILETLLHSSKYENERYVLKCTTGCSRILKDLEESEIDSPSREYERRLETIATIPQGGMEKSVDPSERLHRNNVPARGKTSFVICYRFARVLYFLRACERRGGSRPWIP